VDKLRIAAQWAAETIHHRHLFNAATKLLAELA